MKGGCFAVHPSDTAPALIALNADIITSKRTINAEEFFNVGVLHNTTVLDNDEIVTAIEVSKPEPVTKSAFIKFALRKSIDFPIVNCAAVVTRDDGRAKMARICLNAVSVVPHRAVQAEETLIGKVVDEKTAEDAGIAAVADATPMEGNAYMVELAKAIVKRTILACGDSNGG